MNEKELHTKLESIAEELLNISEVLTETSTDICIDDTDVLINADNIFIAGGIAAAAYMICGIIDGLD